MEDDYKANEPANHEKQKSTKRMSPMVILLGSLPVLLTVSFFALSAAMEADSRANIVRIHRFTAPAKLGTNGYFDQVIADELNDRFTLVHIASARVHDKNTLGEYDENSVLANKTFVTVDADDLLDFQVPYVNVPFEYMVQRFMKWRNIKQDYIRGRITFSEDEDSLYIKSRLSNDCVISDGDKKDRLDELLNLHVRNILACFHPYSLAKYYYVAKDYGKAVQVINVMLVKLPQDDDMFYYNLWGNVLATQGKYQEANGKYYEAVRRKPTNSIFFTDWGNALTRSGRYKEAMSKYAHAVKLDHRSAYALYCWSNLLHKLGRDKEAAEKFRQASGLDPEGIQAIANNEVALRLLEYNYVQEPHVQLINDKTGHASRHAAVVSEKTEWPKNDDMHQRSVIKPNASDRAVYDKKNLAIERIISKHQPDAKLEKGFESTVENSAFYLRWGNALATLTRYKDAISKYEQAVKLDPENADALYKWANALDDLGKHNDAMRKYEQATELNPNNADAFHNWGVLLSESGKNYDAIIKYKRALEIDSNHVDAIIGWGSALSKLGKQQEAITKYEHAIMLDAKNIDALFNWGFALERLGKHAEAVVKYNQVLQLSSNDADALQHRKATLKKKRKKR